MKQETWTPVYLVWCFYNHGRCKRVVGIYRSFEDAWETKKNMWTKYPENEFATETYKLED